MFVEQIWTRSAYLCYQQLVFKVHLKHVLSTSTWIKNLKWYLYIIVAYFLVLALLLKYRVSACIMTCVSHFLWTHFSEAVCSLEKQSITLIIVACLITPAGFTGSVPTLSPYKTICMDRHFQRCVTKSASPECGWICSLLTLRWGLNVWTGTHIRPLKPLLQLQRKALPMGLHTPPFWHGLGTHAVISISQRPPVYWGLQLHENPGKKGRERGGGGDRLHYQFRAVSALFTTAWPKHTHLHLWELTQVLPQSIIIMHTHTHTQLHRCTHA